MTPTHYTCLNWMQAPLGWLPSLLSLCLLMGESRIMAAHLRAGLVRVDITPEQPVTLAGYASRKELSKGTHDPLSARALAFEKDGRRLVLLSTDNLGFYGGTAEPFRQSILEACRLKPSELFLCAIHTHSAPSLTLSTSRGHANNVAYTKALQSTLVKLTQTALGNLQPIRLSVSSGASPVSVNRRQVVRDAEGKTKIVLGRNVSELTDREVQVLKLVVPATGKLEGVLFAYATHSTSLGPGNYLISGDVHGIAEQFLEKYWGQDVVAPGFVGASGDIDPWVRVLPEFRTANGWVPEPVLMGTMLGQEVARVVEAMKQSEEHAEIKSSFTAVQLPTKSEGEQAASMNGAAPLMLSVACVGDIAFVGWGGEIFNDIGKAVKSASPFAHTFIFTHCNGTAGYLPTREAYPRGGYEVQSSSFGPAAADQLVNETVQALRRLKQSH